ncbi:hypothetical protein EHQ43_06145 [Leptospira bouyouniensis]|uniref:Uncharacterized protein n=1 Tax=Leptospira bouyouniensis TaxID=2484911 RepID=A0A7I0HSR5_9LEPT|nr:hypothetical protein [Leptospira bouyouniensis]TGL07005.1 hypothetical protein EHQ43_06145 [Leptospira bouyouniensis]
MKVWIVLFLFLLFFQTLGAAHPVHNKPAFDKCAKFRTGIFDNKCQSGHTSRFKRYASYQVQEYDSMFIKEKIIWNGPCTHTLILMETNDPEISDYIGNTIKVKMVKVEKNKYQTLEEGSSGKSSSCTETKIGELESKD